MMKRKIKQLSILTFIVGSLQSSTFAMDAQKTILKINPYAGDYVTALYKMSYNTLILYFPDQEFTQLANFQKTIANNEKYLSINCKSDNEWLEAYNCLKELYCCSYSHLYHFYTMDEIEKLIIQAKISIKSFLPNDSSFILDNQQQYIKKHQSLGRLFTYKKLQFVIKEKKITHVRLPLKYILVRNTEMQKYISTEQALQVIDNSLKMNIDYTGDLIMDFSSNYEIDIFAKKEKQEGDGFSKATMDELKILFKEAPFDIGYDNIFYDTQGDAIIIDTEYKGTPTKDAYKFNRYRVNEKI